LEPQALIVGAGPVGLTMAAELARYGIAVRIVDKAAHRTDKSKAIVLWSRTLELLDRAGCSEAFVSAGLKVNAANIIAGGKVLGHVSFAGIMSPHAYALGIPQSDTERLLEEHLGKLGVRVERQVEATGFRARNDGVETIIRHADGNNETVESAWLIGCDGAHSTVRHTLGLAFEGDTLKSDWILADVHMDGYPFPQNEMATYWHQSGVLLLFPITAGRCRIIADLGLSEGQAPTDPTLDQITAIVSQRGPAGLKLFDPIWLSAFRINERKVTDYRSGRVFVVGDAAHVHSPAGGQGMNTGMQDAFNLAWKLAMVLQKTCSARLLDSYSVERSAVGAEVLKAAGRLTSVAVMRNPAAQSVRNLIGRIMLGLAPVRNAMVEQMTEISIGYAQSPLNGASVHGLNGPEPGQRILPVSGQSPAGTGSKPLFTLFAEPSEETARLLRDHPTLIDRTLRTPPDTRGMWLGRPDGYTACVSREGNAGPIAAYLAALT
jgi:2-polyprenyl-6-methoxyphenol hydroxylase-like FAD-dependent oxidoreductase